MKEQIPDKKERDEFAAKVVAEGRNPDYHWYTDMYALCKHASDFKGFCLWEETDVACHGSCVVSIVKRMYRTCSLNMQLDV